MQQLYLNDSYESQYAFIAEWIKISLACGTVIVVFVKNKNQGIKIILRLIFFRTLK